eukprot:scaffold12758_cov45-Phaeocystis_antarctica.AAC.1
MRRRSAAAARARARGATAAPHALATSGRSPAAEAARGMGRRARGGARNPLQKSSSHLSPGERCGATAQSALGWYRPRVLVSQRRSAGSSG